MDSRVLAVARARAPEEVAFAIAADEYPVLDAGLYRGWLDQHGVERAGRLVPGDGLARARQLCQFVKSEVGFRGSDDYDDPRGNYLNDVIERRTGSPVAMAVVLMTVGRRAGLDVSGVAFPGHFLVRIEGHYADPLRAVPRSTVSVSSRSLARRSMIRGRRARASSPLASARSPFGCCSTCSGFTSSVAITRARSSRATGCSS